MFHDALVPFAERRIIFMEKRKLVLTIIGVVILAMVIMVYIYFSKPGRDEKKNQQTINQVQTVQQKTNEKKKYIRR